MNNTKLFPVDVNFVDTLLTIIDKRPNELFNHTAYVHEFYQDIQKLVLYVNNILDSELNNPDDIKRVIFNNEIWLNKFVDKNNKLIMSSGRESFTYRDREGLPLFVSGLTCAILNNLNDTNEHIMMTNKRTRQQSKKKFKNKLTKLIKSVNEDDCSTIVLCDSNFQVNQSVVDNIIYGIDYQTKMELSNALCINYQYVYSCLHDNFIYLCTVINNIIYKKHKSAFVIETFFITVDDKQLFNTRNFMNNPYHNKVLKCINQLCEIIKMLFLYDNAHVIHESLSYAVSESFYDKDIFIKKFIKN